MSLDNLRLWNAAKLQKHFFFFKKEGNYFSLTNRPLLIQTPLGKAVHKPDLVVLVPASSRRLEDLDACRQLYVVFVVVAPGG